MNVFDLNYFLGFHWICLNLIGSIKILVELKLNSLEVNGFKRNSIEFKCIEWNLIDFLWNSSDRMRLPLIMLLGFRWV